MIGLCLSRPKPCRRWLVSAHQLLRYSSTEAFKGPKERRPRPSPAKNERNLPELPARTRFAPSPTGHLHLGGLRTALYNYLLARATGGQFILRIEDTDQTRLVPSAEQSLYEDLKWAGLSWDEGPDIGGPKGPYRQSERLSIYHDYANQLLDKGFAFRCFCTPEQLFEHQKHCKETNQPMTYPGTCKTLSPEESQERAHNKEPHTVRFVTTTHPLPHSAFHFRDLVYGTQHVQSWQHDSRILLKSDGYPTYHFANIIDDHLLGITHVIRGAEWLITTPFHQTLYSALALPPPQYAHVCLLTDTHRQKLSKRNHDIGISSFRSQGIIPPALLNFSSLCGWHPGKGSEVMTLQDMISRFTFKFTKGDAMVDFNKLTFFQNTHIKLAASSIPPQKDHLETTFTRPVMDMIPFLDRDKQIVIPDDSPAPMAKTPQKHLEPLTLGTLMVGANPMLAPEENKLKLENHLIRILRHDSQPFQTPPRFLHRHAYLIWTIPPQILSWEHEQLREQFVSVLTAPASDPDTTYKDEFVPISFLEVLHDLKAILEGLSDSTWDFGSEDALSSAVLKTWVNKYHYVEPGNHPTYYKWGWKVLRWVFSGSAEGPPVNQILLLLGKDESMARFVKAYEVAEAKDLVKDS